MKVPVEKVISSHQKLSTFVASAIPLMTTPTPEQIAGKLTEAQRRFLCQQGAGARAGYSLRDKGLLVREFDYWRTTDLGLAVRAHLTKDIRP